MKLISETVATYNIDGKSIDVVLCTEQLSDAETEERIRENGGVLPDDSFHDLWAEGECLNLGEPWFRDGCEDVPSREDVIQFLTSIGGCHE